MSVHQDSILHKIKVMRGRAGSIVKVLSERQAVVRDKVYGDITFTEDVFAFSVEEKGIDFRSYFPIGKQVYFDIEVNDARFVRCTRIWMGKKQKPDLNCSQPICIPYQTENLVGNREYKGTVIKILPPFAFLLELDDSKIHVFVCNRSFKPNRQAPNLERNEIISRYVSKGDKVYVKVYRNSARKKFEWSAYDAWMEDSNTSEPSTRSEDSMCIIRKKRQRKRTRKTKEKTLIMKGRLSFVDTETALLESTDCNGTVSFHRRNAFLFGVAMERLSLNYIFKIGEELNFLLSNNVESEASHVWFGSFDTLSQNWRERLNCIIQYCKERGINDLSVLTTIFQELGRQLPSEEENISNCPTTDLDSASSAGGTIRKELNDFRKNKSDTYELDMYGTVEQNEVVPDEGENISNCLTTDLDSASSAGGTIRKELNDFRKNKSDTNELDMYGTLEQNEVVPDEEENISNCLTTDLDSASSAGGTIRKELNDFWKNKSDTNELDMYGTVEQNELVPSSIVSGNVLVTGSIPDINLTTAAAKENDCTVLTEQNTAPNELTSCTVTTTPSSSCTVIASEHSISNVTAASKKCCSTFVPVITTKQNTTPASEQIGLTIRNMSVLPTSTAGEGHRAVAAANKTFTDSANRSKIEDAEITTDHLKSSIKVGTDSLKDNSNTAGEPVNESDKVTDGKLSSPMACISKYIGVSDESQKHGHADLQKVESESFIPDMGTEIVCLSNCDTELELSISVLNKDLEQNLNLALMSVLKKEVGESASQILAPSVMGLFKKELSCIIQKLMVKALSSVIDNITELKNQDTDSQYEEAGVTRVTRIVEEWKEEFMLVTERQMVEKEKASTQSNQEEDIDDCCNSRNSIDHIGTAYNDGTEDKNTLVESVQDFAQSEKVADCKMMAIPRKISDKGTQTVSTGCILYLKCLRDL